MCSNKKTPYSFSSAPLKLIMLKADRTTADCRTALYVVDGCGVCGQI